MVDGQNLTVGGVWAVSLAVNSAIGLLDRNAVIAHSMPGKVLSSRVVSPYRFDVVAARDGNAILRALELRLQRQEVLVRFEVWIVLADGDQPAQGARKLILRILELLYLFRIGELRTRRFWSGWPWHGPRPRRSARLSPAWHSPERSRPNSGSSPRDAGSCSGRRPTSLSPAPSSVGILLALTHDARARQRTAVARRVRNELEIDLVPVMALLARPTPVEPPGKRQSALEVPPQAWDSVETYLHLAVPNGASPECVPFPNRLANSPIPPVDSQPGRCFFSARGEQYAARRYRESPGRSFDGQDDDRADRDRAGARRHAVARTIPSRRRRASRWAARLPVRGRAVPLRDMLAAIMISSANDASMAVAVPSAAPRRLRRADEQRAQELGMKNTELHSPGTACHPQPTRSLT